MGWETHALDGSASGIAYLQREAEARQLAITAQPAPDSLVIDEADDKDHPHFYCDAARAVSLLQGFEIMALEDRLHRKPGSWHWHIIAERLSSRSASSHSVCR